MNRINQMLKQERGQKSLKTLITVIVVCCIFSFYIIYWSEAFNYVTSSKEATTPLQSNSGSTVRQTLPAYPGHTLKGVGIIFGTYGRENNGVLKFELFADQTLVEELEVDSSNIKDNQLHQFTLNKPVAMSSGVEYSIALTQIYEGDNGVAVWTNSDDASGLAVDDEKQAGTMCFTITCENTALKTKALVVSLVVIAILIAMLLFRVNELTVMASVLTMMLVIYLSVFPLGTIADEPHHFFRAYQIANGGMVSKAVGPNNGGGDIMPRALLSFSDDNAEIDWNDTTEITFPTTALYSPLTYLPQAIGIKVAGLFTNNVSRIYHAGIYSSTLLCLILCVAALYLAPFGRKVLYIIMLFPMTLEEMASISPDGMTISLSIFFLAFIAHISYASEKVKPRDIVILFIAGTILSMCKIVYVVLLFLVFLIPDAKFGNKKSARIFKIGLIATAGLLNLVWLKIASRFLIEFREGVNSRQQVLYLLTHPFDYYIVALRTATLNLHYWAGGMIGWYLGALNIETVLAFWLCFAALFIVTLCDSTTGIYRARPYDAAIMLLVFLAGVALIFTSLYVQWTAVANPLIEGIQGRYFTPLLGILSFAVILMRNSGKGDTLPVRQDAEAGVFYYVLMLSLNGMVLMDVLRHFYVSI